MRALLVRPGPQFSVADVHNGWRDALISLGIDVAEYELDARLNFFSHAKLEIDGELRNAFSGDAAARLAAAGVKQALYDFWPDVVLVTSGFFIPPEFYEVIRARGHKLVALFTESPYEDDRQLARAHHFDLVLINDPTNLEQFRTINPNTHYVPHAYRPEIHKPGPIDPDLMCDLAFVGTGYPSRTEFFRACDLDDLQVKFAGNFQAVKDDPWFVDRMCHPIEFCCDNADAIRLYQSARASLNLYRKEASAELLATGWAMGPREVELAATGTFFLREPRPEGDEVFSMLPTFTEPAEIRPLLDWWLANPAAIERATVAARAAIADRTFANHARWLLELLAF